MGLPNFQVSLRQSMKWVALCAGLFAMMRTPAWPMVLTTAPVVLGFAIDRARGGAGILGAVLAGIVEFVGIGLAFYVYTYFVFHPEGGTGKDISNGLPPVFVAVVFLAAIGVVWGLMVGPWLWLIVFLTGRDVRFGPLRGEAYGPIVWHGLDRPDERACR
jgi:hypothetical protein